MAPYIGYVAAAFSLMLPQVSHAESPGRYAAENVRADPTAESAERFLRGIYAHYSRQNATGDAGVESAYQRAASLFTPRTIALIDVHRKLLTEVGAVDGDPFCDCQDWIAVKVDRVSTKALGPNHAVGTVNFHDHDGPAKEIAFRLQRDNDGWRVDDMTLLGASPDGWLVSILQAETAGLREKMSAKEP
jgi:hypothetical protein